MGVVMKLCRAVMDRIGIIQYKVYEFEVILDCYADLISTQCDVMLCHYFMSIDFIFLYLGRSVRINDDSNRF